MLEHWIDTWRTQPVAIGFMVAYFIQLAMYVGAAGEITLVYGALRRYLKIGALIDARPLIQQQLRHEIGRSLGVAPIYAVPTLLYLYYVPNDATNYATHIWPASWPQAIWQIGGFLLLNDFCAYWTHRLLHTRRFSKYHSAHHRSQRVTPWSALSMHAVEAVLNQIPSAIFLGGLIALQLPMGIGTLLGLQLLLMIGAANSHSNYNPFGAGLLLRMNNWPLLKNQTLFHQRHHRFGYDNYGYMGPHWDVVFGTEHKG
jgi:sterol desaturase/sphingolipid hydroxylase (fatty acid hydroxylase superfamily)